MKYQTKLLRAIEDLKTYIIDSEMGGKLDFEDSFITCYIQLNELKEKVLNDE